MLPGISEASEARLRAVLRPEITTLTAEAIAARPYHALPARDPATCALGIEVAEGAEPLILLTDPARPVGRLRVQAGGGGSVIAIDNAGATGTVVSTMRILGADSLVLIGGLGEAYVQITDLLLRSHGQVLFWGAGASAVGVSIEMEGEGRVTAIGDDALISNGVWIRNHDMHAIHDLGSLAQINRPPCDTVLERHVWLGQEALLLHCERVGMGSIVGARAVAKGIVPPRVMAAGTPARVLRENVSWGRSSHGMTAAERAAIAP